MYHSSARNTISSYIIDITTRLARRNFINLHRSTSQVHHQHLIHIDIINKLSQLNLRKIQKKKRRKRTRKTFPVSNSKII